MRRLLPVIVGFLVGALFCGVFVVSNSIRATPVAQPAPANIAPPINVDTAISSDAEVLPVTSAELSLSATGVVSEVLVSEGDTVNKGQVLLRLDARRQAATAREAQALLDRARFAQAAAQATLTKTLAVLGALKAGTAPDVVSAAQADAAGAAANVHAAESGVASAAAALERAQAKLAVTEVRAPFDGTVVTVNVKPGETLLAGSLAVRLADLTQWKIQTRDLTELAVTRVRVGDSVTIKLDAISDLSLTGKIIRISDFGATNTTKDIVYAVTITPDKVDPRMRWHMTASVNITLQ